MEKIYYVGVLNYMGFTDDDFYFSTLEKAETYFNELLEKAKEDGDSVKKEDDEGENFTEPKHNLPREEPNKVLIIKEINWSKWHKTSFEYDDWEIYPDTIFIKEINIDIVRNMKDRSKNG